MTTENTGTPPAEQQQQQQSAPPAWTTGLDAETIGHIQNRGWHDKPADEVAREAIKAHRAAEGHLGVPADRLVKLPAATAAPEDWDRDVWQRLGAPKAATDYDFSSVKVGDADLPQADADFLRQQAWNARMSPEKALAFAKDYVAQRVNSASSQAAEQTAALVVEKTKLAESWGSNFEANRFIAGQAAQKLGIDPEAITALEGQVGYAKVMEMFRQLGTRMGEATFVSNGQNFNGGVMTKEQASEKKAALMADTAWAKRYLDGDMAAAKEMEAVIRIITS